MQAPGIGTRSTACGRRVFLYRSGPVPRRGPDARGKVAFPVERNTWCKPQTRALSNTAERLIQAGQGQRHQLGEVFGQEDQGALAELVLDGVDRAVVDEADAQQALIAGVAQLVGEQQGEVERGKRIDVLSRFRA